jgi:hypothetical protein
MNSFFQKLASGVPVDAGGSEQVKLLGKRAARSFIEKEADSLTRAVHSVVEEAGLSREQVRRVAEAANQETWNELFHRGGDGSTSFDPADAEAVVGELTRVPEAIGGGSQFDYLSDVRNQVDEVDWSDVFRTTSDDSDYENLNSSRGLEMASEKVASALETTRHGVDVVLSMLAEEGEVFYNLVKQAHLSDDLGILQISKAVGEAVQDPSFAVDVMEQVSARLKGEGIRFNKTAELQKIAGVLVVDLEHPLCKSAAVLEQLSYRYYTSCEELSELRDGHKKAASALRRGK